MNHFRKYLIGIAALTLSALTITAVQAAPLTGVYDLDGIPPTPAPGIEFVGEGGINSPIDFFMATGDVDGDGIDDILMTDYSIDRIGSAQAEGRAYLFFGDGGVGVDPFPVFTPTGADIIFEGANSERLGTSAAMVDLDDDGRMDVVLGAFWGNSNRGEVYVILGSELAPQVPQQTFTPSTEIGSTLEGVVFTSTITDHVGFDAASAGDVDNDGIEDLLFSAPRYDTKKGAAILVYGDTNYSDTGTYTGSYNIADVGCVGAGCVPGARFIGEFADSSWGISQVRSAGDVDGDGYGDMIFGAPFADYTGTNNGAGFIVYGDSAATLTGDFNIIDVYGGTVAAKGARFNMNTSPSSTWIGASIAATGDQNDDGIDDFAIGSSQLDFRLDANPYSKRRENAGALFVYPGSATRYSGTVTMPHNENSVGSTDPIAVIYGRIEDASFGQAATFSGDVNGDGVSDFVVGSRGDSGPKWGDAYLVYGPVANHTGIGIACDFCVDSNLEGTALPGARFKGNDDDLLGTVVANGSDMNNDGLNDILYAKKGTTSVNKASRADLVWGGEQIDLPEGGLVDYTGGYVLAPVAGTFYRNGVGSPSVTYDPFNDQYVMAFESRLDAADYPAGDYSSCEFAAGGVGVWGIGIATSADGLSWTVLDQVIEPDDGTYYGCVAAHPSLMFDGNRWRIWFKSEQPDLSADAACLASPPSWGCNQYTGIGYAELDQQDINTYYASFAIDATPVINDPTFVGNIGFPDIVRTDFYHPVELTTYRQYTAYAEYNGLIYSSKSFSPNSGWSLPELVYTPADTPWVADWEADVDYDTHLYNPTATCREDGSNRNVVLFGARKMNAGAGYGVNGEMEDLRNGFTFSAGNQEIWDHNANDLMDAGGVNPSTAQRHFDIVRAGDEYLVYHTEIDGGQVKVKMGYTDSTWDGSTVTWNVNDISPNICPIPTAYDALL